VTASSASRRPIKGILKNKRSTVSSVVVSTQQSRGVIPEVQRKKTQKWDQLNILATSRPAYRNYDFMKINEPSSHHLGRYHRLSRHWQPFLLSNILSFVETGLFLFSSLWPIQSSNVRTSRK
uniref:Uncharacterized protein n=1 Tax=Felis catus TaxID=9685 RepID=A0ABI7VV39_FELCA